MLQTCESRGERRRKAGRDREGGRRTWEKKHVLGTERRHCPWVASRYYHKSATTFIGPGAIGPFNFTGPGVLGAREASRLSVPTPLCSEYIFERVY